MMDWKEKVIVALAVAGILAGATGLMKLSVIESAFADTKERVKRNEDRSQANVADKRALEERIKGLEAKVDAVQEDTKQILRHLRRTRTD